MGRCSRIKAGFPKLGSLVRLFALFQRCSLIFAGSRGGSSGMGMGMGWGRDGIEVGQDRIGQDRLGQDGRGWDRLGQADTGRDRTGRTFPGHGKATLCGHTTTNTGGCDHRAEPWHPQLVGNLSQVWGNPKTPNTPNPCPLPHPCPSLPISPIPQMCCQARTLEGISSSRFYS